MKNTKKQDLLTEVNLMRSMMGLKPKTLITEAIIPIPLLKSFAKTATKYASKSASEIASELGSVARTTKSMFDDLDVAIKAGDQAGTKAMITNIVNTLDDNALRIIADDIFADTADDAVRSFVTKRVEALKGGGVTDDAIKQQIKNDLDILFDEVPDKLRFQIKNVSDNIVNDVISKTAKISTNVVTSAGVLGKLSKSQEWVNFINKFPELRSVFIQRIDDLIAAGAKSEDEVFSIIEGQASKKLKPSAWNKIKGFKAKNPTAYKVAIWVIGAGIASAIAGKAGILPKLGKWICEFLIGEDDEWCLTMFSSAYEETNDTEPMTSEGCDKTLDDFKNYIENTIGIDSSDATFDPSTCTGTILGERYKWNGNDWE